jgi:hypothetical protein
VRVEVLLELLVGEVDAELLKVVDGKLLKACLFFVFCYWEREKD